MEEYYEANSFLTDVNNEIAFAANKTYAAHLATLDALVLVLFSRDETVVPKESAWFGSYAPTPPGARAPDEPRLIVPMRNQPLYVQDLIGLRELDESGKVVFVTGAK